jgi:hypothetical protein
LLDNFLSNLVKNLLNRLIDEPRHLTRWDVEARTRLQ